MKPLLHPVRHFTRRPRLTGTAALALLAYSALLQVMPAARAALLAFDLGAGMFLLLMGVMMFRSDVASIRQRASDHDEGKWTVLASTLCVTGFVLWALGHELHAARTRSPWDLALTSSTIVMAWLVVAVTFAQQYAHSFYVIPGQLVFPGTAEPDYWDFTYFALVISMCFQTSDVAVTSAGLRREVMLHSVLSFFFNVIILAITVNVVAGVL